VPSPTATGPHRSDQLLRCGALEEEAPGTGAHRRKKVVVDPGGCRQPGRDWPVAEAIRAGGIGGVQGGGALGADLTGGAVVDRGGGVQADAAVPVLVVVVGEERLAERSGVGQGPEAAGEGRAVLQRLELGFAERVVVGHVRPAVAAGDSEVDEQLRDRQHLVLQAAAHDGIEPLDLRGCRRRQVATLEDGVDRHPGDELGRGDRVLAGGVLDHAL